VRHITILFAALAVGAGAFAQDYPSHPIRLVAPNPAGGATDAIARIVAGKLADLLGAQIVIDNRGGAGGTIAGDIAAHAAPDGYTLLAGSVSTHSFAPIIYRKLPYDPIKDFAPISLFAIVQNLLVVNLAVPAANVKELIALAKAKPGTLNYSSAGSGTTSHFAVAMFVSVTGLSRYVVHIPYKGGAQALTATAAGEAHINFGPMPGSMVALVKAGKLRPLAVGGATRSPTLPEVPTMAESGFPAYQSAGWYGLLAPAGTPRAIIMRLNQAVVAAANAADTKQHMLNVGGEPASDTPEVFAQFIRDQLALHRKIVREEGIKFE
jgi:tripartite-type tricarboxylate transporter receptor subunit TctC